MKLLVKIEYYFFFPYLSDKKIPINGRMKKKKSIKYKTHER